MKAVGAVRGMAFDAYGTLFDVYAIASKAEELFPSQGADLAGLWREKQIQYTWLRTLSGRYASFRRCTEDALEYSCEKLGLVLTLERRQMLMDQYGRLQAHPESLDALRHLRELGLPLAVLTNGDPEMIGELIRSAGMNGLFEHVLSAQAVRQFKVAPDVYQLGPDALGLPVEQILFVSSNNWDIAGAAWYGYPTFWINRAGRPRERLGVSPSGEGRSLDDLVEFAVNQLQR